MATAENNDDPAEVSTHHSPWKLPAFLGVLLVVLVGVGMYDPAENAPDKNSDAATVEGKVTLAIDTGEGAGPSATHGFRQGMTVLDLLQQSGRAVEVLGEGEMAFVTAIDGLRNGADGSGWQYEVNGVSGDRSAAVYTLQQDDHVLWRHGPYE